MKLIKPLVLALASVPISINAYASNLIKNIAENQIGFQLKN